MSGCHQPIPAVSGWLCNTCVDQSPTGLVVGHFTDPEGHLIEIVERSE